MRDQDVVEAGEKSPHEEESRHHRQGAAVVLGSVRGADGIRTLLGSWCHAHLCDLDVRNSRNCIPPQLHAQQKSSTNRRIGCGAAGIPNERRLCACWGGSSHHCLTGAKNVAVIESLWMDRKRERMQTAPRVKITKPLTAPPSRPRFFHLTLRFPWILSLCPVSYTHLRAHETVLDLVCR